jgi:hypothetical protein
VIYIDLVDLDRETAKNALLAGVRQSRALPVLEPLYPGNTVSLPQTPGPRFPNAFPPIWNIPYRRNPYFTGREEVLNQLTAHYVQGNRQRSRSQRRMCTCKRLVAWVE